MEKFGKGYDTVEDAAAAALQFIERQPRASEVEYMTLVVQDEDGKFYRTKLATSGMKGKVRSEDANFAVRPGSLRAVVHNHPVSGPQAKFLNEHFSDTDAEMAAKLGVPSFISAMRRDTIPTHRLLPVEGRKPAVPVAGSDLTGKRRHSVPGQDFLAMIPIDELKTLLMRDLFSRAPNDPRGLRREEPQAVTPRQILANRQ